MPSTLNQNNQQQANQSDNFASGGNIGGYSSPYSSPIANQSQTTPQPVPQSSTQSQQSSSAPVQPQPQIPQQTTTPLTTDQSKEKEVGKQSEPETPDLQDFLSGNIPPVPEVTKAPEQQVPVSDNLLDHPEKVDEIMKTGVAKTLPTPNAPQVPAQLQSPIPPAPVHSQPQQSATTLPVPPQPQSSIPVQQKPVQPLPKPMQQNQPVLPTVQNVVKSQPVGSNTDLNPEEDLKILTPKNVDGSSINTDQYQNISTLLDLVIEKKGSDVHLTVGYPPFLRVDDKLIPVGSPLTKDDVKKLITQTLTSNQRELLEVNREVDLSYQHKDQGRFRINAYYERGNLAAAYRLIPQKIKSITELNLPGLLLDVTKASQGLFLVTGPTGSGKSTTLAAMIQHINETAPKHIITIEDPIEYVYPKNVALVDQRELGGDTHDWSIALKSALRQDPDIILIGEMRDFETIQSAITLAETGHLVFATLHTNSAAQSIDRIIDVFPPYQQEQIKTQLAGSLKGILSQRLAPLIGGGRQAVVELLLITPAVQNLIREGKTYQLDNVIATGTDLGMISMEKSLVKLVREGKITTATAQEYAIRPDEILKLMKGGSY